MLIMNNEVVKNELSRMNGLVGTEWDRDVEWDIELLKTALEKINLIITGEAEHVVIDSNMWIECHESLWKILDALGLDVDMNLSVFDYYEWYIRKI